MELYRRLNLPREPSRYSEFTSPNPVAVIFGTRLYCPVSATGFYLSIYVVDELCFKGNVVLYELTVLERLANKSSKR